MTVEKNGTKCLADTFGVDLPDEILKEIERFGNLDQVCESGEYLLHLDGGVWDIEIYALTTGKVVLIYGIVDYEGVTHRESAKIINMNELSNEVYKFYVETKSDVRDIAINIKSTINDLSQLLESVKSTDRESYELVLNWFVQRMDKEVLSVFSIAKEEDLQI